jgi:hypothetical protein
MGNDYDHNPPKIIERKGMLKRGGRIGPQNKDQGIWNGEVQGDLLSLCRGLYFQKNIQRPMFNDPFSIEEPCSTARRSRLSVEPCAFSK